MFLKCSGFRKKAIIGLIIGIICMMRIDLVAGDTQMSNPITRLDLLYKHSQGSSIGTEYEATRADGTKEPLVFDPVNKKDRLARKKRSLWLGLGSCLVAVAPILAAICNRNVFSKPSPNRNIIGLLGYSVFALGICGTRYFKDKYNREKFWLDKRKHTSNEEAALVQGLYSSNREISDKLFDVLPEETRLVQQNIPIKRDEMRPTPRKDEVFPVKTPMKIKKFSVTDSYYDGPTKAKIRSILLTEIDETQNMSYEFIANIAKQSRHEQ